MTVARVLDWLCEERDGALTLGIKGKRQVSENTLGKP
jgi:hypothetical protein